MSALRHDDRSRGDDDRAATLSKLVAEVMVGMADDGWPDDLTDS